MSKRETKSPSKCVITMGEKITRTKFSGKVSGVNLINAIIHLVKDVKTTTGMPPSGVLSIVGETFGYKIVKMEPNPTMRASESEATASEDEDED